MRRLLLLVPGVTIGVTVIVVAMWPGGRSADLVATAGQPVAVMSATPSAEPSSAPTAQPSPQPPGPRPDPTWVSDIAARTGINPRAMSAYAAASLRMRDEQPGCRLGWTTLAGIGQVESGHARGRLDADGRSVDTINGPELDGSGGNAAIAEGGAWDRARGPMQFIASTWRAWASDNDGDGVADVDDVDDAAWSAARYLCASGGDLTAGTGWSRAVFSYNHSETYVRAILSTANAYAKASAA